MRGGCILLFFLFSFFAYSQNSIEDVKEIYFVDDRNWKDYINDDSLQPDYINVETADMKRLDEILKTYRPLKRTRYRMPVGILYGMIVSDTGDFNIRLSPTVIGVYNKNERYYHFIEKPEDQEWLKKFSEKIKSKFTTP